MIRGRTGPDSDPVHSTHFTRRLESFNDVVFGFSLSLLAIQLQSAQGAPPGRFAGMLALFFLTFTLVATIWYTHYQTFHYAFAAQKLDVFLNFALLACSALVPFMFEQMNRNEDKVLALDGLAGYALVFSAVYGISAVLKLRGLKRFGDRIEPAAQRSVFRGICVCLAVPVAGVLAILCTDRFGPVGASAFWLIALASPLARRVRTVPAFLLPARAAD